jgi:hypothetical protein
MARKRSAGINDPGQSAQEPPKTPAPAEPDDPVKVWLERLTAANKDYEAWAKEFRTARLLQYVRGKHWHGLSEADKQKKYTINLIFASIETALPSLLFNRPKVVVEAQPDRLQDVDSDVGNRATLIESAIQTQIDRRDIKFGKRTELALRNAFTHFGLIEVGYSADWIDNPNANKPVLKSDNTPLEDGDGRPVLQPAKVLRPGRQSESLYLKQIPAANFRVWPGYPVLQDNDWAAYCEWVQVEDVKSNPAYENTQGLNATGAVGGQLDDPDNRNEKDTARRKRTNQVRLWKVWDFRAKKRYVLAVGHSKMLMDGKPYSHFPISAIKFYELDESWYPIPPVFNWLCSQDEINEIRESWRTHRRRFVRRYMRQASVKQEEWDKLEAGEDGVCIEVPQVDPPPIAAIADADLSAQNIPIALAAAKEDFMQMTGLSGEQRGVPEAETATQANIVNVRAQIREGSLRERVAEWLADVCRLMLLTMTSQMQQEVRVKLTTDPFKPSPKALGATDEGWKEVKAEELTKDLDVDVRVDVTSLSPVAQDARRLQRQNLMMLLASPFVLALVSKADPQAPDQPPPLLRQMLSDYSIDSDHEVREWWRVLQAVQADQQQMQLMAMMAKATGGQPGMGPGVPGMSALPGLLPAASGVGAPAGQPSAAPVGT